MLTGLLLASRDIVGGIAHMKKLGEEGLARERVEKDKVTNYLCLWRCMCLCLWLEKRARHGSVCRETR